MVFFNYSTMQMAAKVVYYGPGLCGKTTNLHYIYAHTANDSRGEMVSLETETDRTLFFDLLPIDVGSIAGFNTRIQLYTVPGQVFYNTTRKLVLKGVDGVVFVADSQRAMLQANVDSFRNLEENLAEMGLSVESLPLVLQYNKRDLADIASVEELNQAVNRGNWPHFEACAINGQGVYETLKGISKVTLISLKKRLARPETAARPAPVPRPTLAPPQPSPASPRAPVARPPAPPAEPAPLAAAPAGRELAAQPAAPAATPPFATATPAQREAAGAAKLPPLPVPPATPPRAPAAAAGGRAAGRDVLSELETLRRQAMQAPPARNGRGELSRNVELNLPRADFARARRVTVSLQVEDEAHQVVESIKDLQVDIQDAASLKKLLLRLNIALNASE